MHLPLSRSLVYFFPLLLLLSFTTFLVCIGAIQQPFPFVLIIFPVSPFLFVAFHVYVTLRLVFFVILSLTFFFLFLFFVLMLTFVATIAIVAAPAAAAKNKINQKLSVIFCFFRSFSFRSFIHAIDSCTRSYSLIIRSLSFFLSLSRRIDQSIHPSIYLSMSIFFAHTIRLFSFVCISIIK